MRDYLWLVVDDCETTEHADYEEALQEAKDRVCRDTSRRRTVFKAVTHVNAVLDYRVEEIS